ncbi:MAG: fliH [Cyanobacteria bacterium RYN_339]|nr:fliH [Cyanobacteria bacterium RYN_339]
MAMTPKIIKSSRFEDGTYAIKAPVHPLPMIDPEEGLNGPFVDPVLLAAELESREVLRRAREQADAAMAQASAHFAEREAELLARMSEEREQVLEAARREGFGVGLAEGRDAGQQMVVDEHAAALATLHNATELAAAERALWFEKQEKDLVKLAILIAQKILLMELATSRDSIVEMAQAAIKHVTDKTHVRVRIHPGDLPRLNAARQQLMLAVDNLTSLELVGDPEVGVGGCMIDTRTGMVDARLATQLAEVAAALLDIVPGPDGAGDLDPMVLAAVRALGQGGHVLAAAPAAAPTWQRPVAPAPQPAPVAAPAPVAPAPVVQEAVVAPVAPVPAPDPVVYAPVELPQATYRVPEAVWEAPVAPAPDPVYEVPVAAPAPAPHVPAVEPPRSHVVDPSRRAADALAARLGQLKKGRGVVTLSEELDLAQIEGGLADADLEAIVKQTARNVIATEIDTSQVLVHNPYALEEAADALAERLGKKRTRRPGDEASLGDVLGDNKIDEIMGTLMHRIAEEPVVEAPEAANIDKASENLAKLLGKTKKKSNRPWYEQ